MNLTLEPYQEEMRDFLVANQRAALFVSPGMGKTASVLSALNILFAEGEIRSALVIAPLRVATLSWPNEIQRWQPFHWMRVENIRKKKPSGRGHIHLLNYESIQKLDSLDAFDVVVLDELSKCKNPRSVRVKHLSKLFKHQRRWGLTGTPRPQGLADVFAQIRTLDDGQRLGKSFNQFQQTWMTPLDFMQYHWAPREGAEAAIYEKIRDLTITMRASDYLHLPDTIVEDIEVPLPDSAKAVYKELEKELLVAIGDEGDVIAQTAATLVNKLLQITGGFVYMEDREVAQVHGAKIDALKSLLKKFDGENVIVFTNYLHERAAVVKAINGQDASEVKGDIETLWNMGKLPRLVADPRSLGHGLNLQRGGRRIIFYSQTWSRELFDQSIARIARKGQDQETYIYRLVCPGTVDDSVIESLRQRGEGQSAMMSVLSNFRKLVLTQA